MNFLVFQRALAAIGFCAAIGVLLILVITLRKEKQVDARSLWKKFAVYMLLVVAMLSGIACGQTRWIVPVILLAGLGELLYARFRAKESLQAAQLVVSFLIYLLFAAGCWLLRLEDRHHILVLYTGVVVFDGFSQLAGHLAGTKKLAPKLSPGKTVEGFIGGALALVPVFCWLEPGARLWQQLLFAAVFAVTALGGDLLASKYKRICGVKDYSRLLPGHGGVLDRFDSFIAVSAVWMYFSLL